MSQVEVVIADVLLIPLRVNGDERGVLVELYGSHWPGAPTLHQFNWVRCAAGTLRGVHVHSTHIDWLTVIDGEILVGLYDCRPDSPTFGLGQFVTLKAREPRALMIPEGVAHGFCSQQAGTFVYGLSNRWSMAGEKTIQWNDPALGLDWPLKDPLLSERDKNGRPLSVVLAEISDAVDA